MMIRSAASVAKLWGIVGLLVCLTGCAEISRGGPPVRVSGGTLFRLFAPEAAQVSLIGSFNDWDPTASPLHKIDSNGLWEVVVSLPRGRHQYMFLVDGKWVTPPNAPLFLPDGFGRQNGLLVVE